MHDERCEDIILHATLPAEYERVRNASYEKRGFGLDEIRHMVHTRYADDLSRPCNAQLIAGRGIAMQATGHNAIDVQRNYCKCVDRAIQDCAVLKAKERRNGWVNTTQTARASPRQGGRRIGEETGGRQPMLLLPQVYNAQRRGMPHPASQQ